MKECIVAYTGEGPEYRPFVEGAVRIAREREASLILYDVDAASAFSEPLPTWWSADGMKEQFGERLSPTELEKAGREVLRDWVEEARRAGVEAYGWLPTKRDATALTEYAGDQRATLLVIPSSLEDKSLRDRFQGKPSADDVNEQAPIPVIELDLARDE